MFEHVVNSDHIRTDKASKPNQVRDVHQIAAMLANRLAKFQPARRESPGGSGIIPNVWRQGTNLMNAFRRSDKEILILQFRPPELDDVPDVVPTPNRNPAHRCDLTEMIKHNGEKTLGKSVAYRTTPMEARRPRPCGSNRRSPACPAVVQWVVTPSRSVIEVHVGE